MSIQDRVYSVASEIADTKFERPHVVILGAGASRATFPNGDAHGIKLPLMNDLIDMLDLKNEFCKYKIDLGENNFEVVYNELLERNLEDLRVLVEVRAHDYFAQLKLPNYPTIYDHLVMSLRKKDLIATFNWDPFLYSACWRNHKKIENLPQVVYLHGNVAVGYCLTCMRKGFVRSNCSKCGELFTPSKLLFPIKKKNYNENPFIKTEWESLKVCLKNAYMLTVFGYSAPQYDVEAVALMKDAWGDAGKRNLEEIEIIDIRPEDQLSNTWKPFIHSHHYTVHDNFYNSWISKHPRRSCEAMWAQLMEVQFVVDHDIPKNFDFEQLWEWYKPIVAAENKH